MSQTKKRTPRTSTKRAGGEWGDRIRHNLNELKGERSAKQWARDLKLGSRAVTQWLSADALPSAAALRAISDHEKVSTDWLLDYDVPKRRSDRELAGDLAEALLKYVVPEYARRRAGIDLFVWAVAEILHGDVTKKSLLQPDDARLFVQFRPRSGDPRGIAVADRQHFLADVVDWVHSRVAEIMARETAQQESTVRNDMEQALKNLRLVAKRSGLTAEEQLPHALSFLEAAVNPRDARKAELARMRAAELHNDALTHKVTGRATRVFRRRP